MDEHRMARVLAYVDGELAPDDVAAFESEMALDSDLAREVERHAALTTAVFRAYAPVLEEAVPARLTTVAAAANDSGARRWVPWAAAAASLVVGLLVGRAGLPAGDLVQGRDGLVARGALAQGLTTQLAADAGPIRVGLTFKDLDGRWCRTFESRPDRLAGLACREDARWRVALATVVGRDAAPTYRPAGNETPPAVLAAVDVMRAGDPVDAVAERRARDAGWR